MPKIIQFFHPGQEHGFDKNREYNGLYLKDWNRSSHKRKFVLNDGYYFENGKKDKGELLFWCEWEPPSKVEDLTLQTENVLYGGNPKYLHHPFLPPDDQLRTYQGQAQNCESNSGNDCHSNCSPQSGGSQNDEKNGYQNTDPFVFGDCFIYAICRQWMPSLRDLDDGSLILFGSRVNLRYAIDTVFVVKNGKLHHCLQDVMNMQLGIYPEIVTRFIVDGNNQLNPPKGNFIYRGATYDEPHNGMYSFVPAKVYSKEKRGFPRFVMPDEFYKDQKLQKYFSKRDVVNGKITEQQTQGIKVNDADENVIKYFWEYLKNEISKEHVLGVKFNMPCVDEDFRYAKSKSMRKSSNSSNSTSCIK